MGRRRKRPQVVTISSTSSDSDSEHRKLWPKKRKAYVESESQDGFENISSEESSFLFSKYCETKSLSPTVSKSTRKPIWEGPPPFKRYSDTDQELPQPSETAPQPSESPSPVSANIFERLRKVAESSESKTQDESRNMTIASPAIQPKQNFVPMVDLTLSDEENEPSHPKEKCSNQPSTSAQLSPICVFSNTDSVDSSVARKGPRSPISPLSQLPLQIDESSQSIPAKRQLYKTPEKSPSKSLNSSPPELVTDLVESSSSSTSLSNGKNPIMKDCYVSLVPISLSRFLDERQRASSESREKSPEIVSTIPINPVTVDDSSPITISDDSMSDIEEPVIVPAQDNSPSPSINRESSPAEVTEAETMEISRGKMHENIYPAFAPSGKDLPSDEARSDSEAQKVCDERFIAVSEEDSSESLFQDRHDTTAPDLFPDCEPSTSYAASTGSSPTNDTTAQAMTPTPTEETVPLPTKATEKSILDFINEKYLEPNQSNARKTISAKENKASHQSPKQNQPEKDLAEVTKRVKQRLSDKKGPQIIAPRKAKLNVQQGPVRRKLNVTGRIESDVGIPATSAKRKLSIPSGSGPTTAGADPFAVPGTPVTAEPGMSKPIVPPLPSPGARSVPDLPITSTVPVLSADCPNSDSVSLCQPTTSAQNTDKLPFESALTANSPRSRKRLALIPSPPSPSKSQKKPGVRSPKRLPGSPALSQSFMAKRILAKATNASRPVNRGKNRTPMKTKSTQKVAEVSGFTQSPLSQLLPPDFGCIQAPSTSKTSETRPYVIPRKVNLNPTEKGSQPEPAEKDQSGRKYFLKTASGFKPVATVASVQVRKRQAQAPPVALNRALVSNLKKRRLDEVSESRSSDSTNDRRVKWSSNLERVREISPRREINDSLLESLLNSEGFNPEIASPRDDSLDVKVVESFEQAILRWNPNWLEEKDETDKTLLPPIFGRGQEGIFRESLPAGKRPMTFRNLDEYLETFRPLFLCEIWESVQQSYRSKQDGSVLSVNFDFMVQRQSDSQDFRILRCGTIIPKHHEHLARALDSTLLKVNIGTESGITGNAFFAIVSKSGYRHLHSPKDVPEFLLAQFDRMAYNCGPKTLGLLICDLKLRRKSNLPQGNYRAVKAMTVCSMVSSMRIIKGLSKLAESDLMQSILRPKREDFTVDGYMGDAMRAPGAYNPSQQEVITSLARDVVDAKKTKRLCLVHGPPGTGKSRTICGLIEEIKHRKLETDMKGVIVLAAASNAAVDELSRSIIKRNKEIAPYGGSSTGKTKFRINFVRFGNNDQVADDVKDYTLDHLIMKNAEQECRGAKPPEIVQLEAQRMSYFSQGKIINGMESRVRDIDENLRRLKSQLAPKSNFSMYSRVAKEKRFQMLMCADVVATTLNSAGSPVLDDLTSGAIPILCVIVDEACQATELETIIPLRFPTRKLFLVGDPFQLPPTVLSNAATDRLFGESFFTRAYTHLLNSGAGEVVKLLNVQYRMVPEIAEFPSRHIYNSRIITPNEIAVKPHFILPPYLVFDLDYGVEDRGNRGSVRNRSEAEIVLSLCQRIVQSGRTSPSKIGIITFYRGQVHEIQAELDQKRELKGTEVSTVDGFQGREKEIIILSCVRSSGQKNGSVGFLCDQRRMTVAITRAKRGLYIVANGKSLGRDPNWSALLIDASARNLRIQVTGGRISSFGHILDSIQETQSQVTASTSKTSDSLNFVTQNFFKAVTLKGSGSDPGVSDRGQSRRGHPAAVDPAIYAYNYRPSNQMNRR